MYSKLKEYVEKAFSEGEIPIACMLRNKITGEEYYFYNQKEVKKSILGHAEVEAISYVSNLISDFRLNDFEMVVTTDPCIMCMGCIIESRVSKVTILSKKDKYELSQLDKYINSSTTMIQYDEVPYFKEIIKRFFKNKR